jgi:hypothetical protein
LKRIVATIYAQLIGTILLYPDCVIAGGNRALGTSYVPTSIEHIQLLYQPPAGLYNLIGFVPVDRAIVGKDSVIEWKVRVVAAPMGADAVTIGDLKKLRYLGPVFRNISKVMKRAKMKAGSLTKFNTWLQLVRTWSQLARNPQVLKLFGSAIVSAALLIGAVCAVHLLISLLRKPRTRVFISFEHEREPIADMLANEMTKAGMSAEKHPFVKSPGHNILLRKLRQGIRDCDIFVCVPGIRPSFVDSEVFLASGLHKPIVFVLIEAEAPHVPNTALYGYPVFSWERLQRLRRAGFRVLASFCSYLAADWRSTVRVYGAVFNHLFASTVLVLAVYLISTLILTEVMRSSRGPHVAVPPVGFFSTSVSNPVFLCICVSPLILFLIFYGSFFITRWRKRAQIKKMISDQKFRDSSLPKTLSSSLTRAHLDKILYRGDIVAHHESLQA